VIIEIEAYCASYDVLQALVGFKTFFSVVVALQRRKLKKKMTMEPLVNK